MICHLKWAPKRWESRAVTSVCAPRRLADEIRKRAIKGLNHGNPQQSTLAASFYSENNTNRGSKSFTTSAPGCRAWRCRPSRPAKRRQLLDVGIPSTSTGRIARASLCEYTQAVLRVSVKPTHECNRCAGCLFRPDQRTSCLPVSDIGPCPFHGRLCLVG